jgi:hypothetical protein
LEFLTNITGHSNQFPNLTNWIWFSQMIKKLKQMKTWWKIPQLHNINDALSYKHIIIVTCQCLQER